VKNIFEDSGHGDAGIEISTSFMVPVHWICFYARYHHDIQARTEKLPLAS